MKTKTARNTNAGEGAAGSGVAARELRGVEDLAPAPYNPRTISAEAAAGLRRSLAEFGDISGLVWNRRTGHLVAGHQRLDALRREHGDGLKIDETDGGAVLTTPTGERFAVRVVDWDLGREKAANVAANNPLIAGEFVADDLEAIMRELRLDETTAGLLDALRLGELVPALRDLLDGDEASNSRGDGGERGPNGEIIEHLNFAVTFTVAEHETVTSAVRLAKQRGAGTTPAALAAICRHYMETNDED